MSNKEGNTTLTQRIQAISLADGSERNVMHVEKQELSLATTTTT